MNIFNESNQKLRSLDLMYLNINFGRDTLSVKYAGLNIIPRCLCRQSLVCKYVQRWRWDSLLCFAHRPTIL